MVDMGTVGVIGAGLMGNGIAQVCAAAGLEVVLYDIKGEAVAKAISAIGDRVERLNRKNPAAPAREAVLARIRGTDAIGDLGPCGFLIEAATENHAVKQAILQAVEKEVRREAVIASNTSSISITKLAAALEAPERMIGMHFFNPVPVMSLVEIIRGMQTGDAAFAAAQALARRMGKRPIAVRNAPGFVINRILCPMINEAVFALQEGIATREDIDEGMKLGANHPIGPLQLADLVGLDTFLSVMETFYTDFNDPKYRPAPLLKEMVDAGYLGRKSGRGFYDYG